MAPGTPTAKKGIEDVGAPEDKLQAQAKPPKYQVKAIDKLSFTFGPEQSYFLVTAHEWACSGSQSVAGLVGNINARSIETATITFLGDGLIVNWPPENNPVVYTWQQTDRSIPVSQAKAWAESREQLRRLHDRLENGVRDNIRPDIEVIWGDGNTWWAGWSEGEWVGNQLPKTLSDEIQSHEALGIKPRHVALGRSGSWVALWTDGGFSFNLNAYETLQNKLNDTEKGGIKYVALDPHTSERYFMVMDGGDVSYSVRLPEDSSNNLFDQICRYQQRRAWRDKKSYSQHRFGTGHKSYSVDITPDTDWVSTDASQQQSVSAPWPGIRFNGEEVGFRSIASMFLGGLTGAAVATGLWRTYAKRPSTPIQHRVFPGMRQGARLWGTRLGFPLGVAVGGLLAFLYKR